jgi:hypothetical protein
MSALPKREHLRRLVELLPARDLDTAERLLEGLIALEGDPFLRALAAAPEDDEPITQEDIEAEAEADRAIAEGHVSAHADVMHRLGL